MTFDTIEQSAVAVNEVSTYENIGTMGKSFDSSVSSVDGVYQSLDAGNLKSMSRWLGIDESMLSKIPTSEYMEITKQMLYGTEVEGNTTRGLVEISNMKKNEQYYNQNLRQQAGFSAEVISTAKENMIAKAEGTGITTYRADDRPDLFPRNDQYVDKIRVNESGEIVERIQSKFVGKDGNACLEKLMSKDYDKYFDDGKVDTIEIAKDKYDEIIDGKMVEQKRADLQKQLERVKVEGKEDVAENLQRKLDRLDKIDEMVKPSTVTEDEAIYATKHPKRYVAKAYAKEVAKAGNEVGMSSAKTAAAITFAVSTVENVQEVIDGEKAPEEAFVDVAKDTAVSTAVAYGSGFVSGAVATAMSSSSHQLIKTLGKSGVPGAVVSFGVDSYDSVIDYAQGEIDETQLAIDLGESAIGVVGSMAGSAIAGAVVGSVVPGAGTVVGAAAGLVGGMVGYAVTTEAYQTAIEFGTENAELLANQAKEIANNTIEAAKTAIPDKVENVKEAMNSFAAKAKLPFSFA